jgi:hypothetical protein
MHVILPIVAVLALLMAGFGIAVSLAPRSRSMGMLEALSLSFLLGAGFVSLASFSTSLFYRGPMLVWVVSSSSVALGIAGMLALLRDPSRLRLSFPSDVRTIVFSTILAVQTAVVMWVALHETLGWDGLVVWELKARLAYLQGGAVPTSYFSDPTRAWSHPEYPLLLPLTESWFYVGLGGPHQGYAKIILALFYPVAIGMLYSGASRLGGRSWRGLLAGFLLFFIPTAVVGEGSATSGYADFPLAVFYLGSAVYATEYLQSGEKGALALAGVLAAFLPWTKQEGIILWLCAAALIIAAGARSQALRPALTAILPGLLVFLGWRAFLASVNAPQLRDFEPLSVTTLWSNLGRLQYLAQWLLVEFTNSERWSLLWPALGLALLFMLARRRKPAYGTLAAAAVLPLLLYPLIYVFSAYSPFLGHVENSLPRLMLHASLVALMVIALAVPARRRQGLHSPHDHWAGRETELGLCASSETVSDRPT